MSQADIGERSGNDSAVRTAQGGASSGREYVSEAMRYVRSGVESGAFAGASGGVSLFRGLRSLRRGDSLRGLGRLLLGGLFVAIAVVQRRSKSGGSAGGERERGGVDQTDVVDTGPDIEDVSEGMTAGDQSHASGDEAAAVVDAGPDIEDAEPSLESDSDAETTDGDQIDTRTADVDQTDVVETGIDEEELADVAGDSYRRLGEAAFDEHGREIPVPQRAFNQNFLALGAEAFWGIREADDVVLVSQLYDPIEDREGVQYVASSQVDEDRMLSIPDAVVDHWDVVAGGGTAVAGGDDLVFATSDELKEDSQLVVVPEQWADDVLGENA